MNINLANFLDDCALIAAGGLDNELSATDRDIVSGYLNRANARVLMPGRGKAPRRKNAWNCKFRRQRAEGGGQSGKSAFAYPHRD